MVLTHRSLFQDFYCPFALDQSPNPSFLLKRLLHYKVLKQDFLFFFTQSCYMISVSLVVNVFRTSSLLVLYLLPTSIVLGHSLPFTQFYFNLSIRSIRYYSLVPTYDYTVTSDDVLRFVRGLILPLSSLPILYKSTVQIS